jgi:hypothetical protein
MVDIFKSVNLQAQCRVGLPHMVVSKYSDFNWENLSYGQFGSQSRPPLPPPPPVLPASVSEFGEQCMWAGSTGVSLP